MKKTIALLWSMSTRDSVWCVEAFIHESVDALSTEHIISVRQWASVAFSLRFSFPFFGKSSLWLELRRLPQILLVLVRRTIN